VSKNEDVIFEAVLMLNCTIHNRKSQTIYCN